MTDLEGPWNKLLREKYDPANCGNKNYESLLEQMQAGLETPSYLGRPLQRLNGVTVVSLSPRQCLLNHTLASPEHFACRSYTASLVTLDFTGQLARIV